MPFILIKGTFHVLGYSPDGDSVKFKALRRSSWRKLGGRPVSGNSRDHVQLRLEGIDSLETHYGRERSHQPLGLAHEATAALLRGLRISGVRWGPAQGEVTAANDGKPGYLLARETGPYGRPICFAFRGSTSRADGSSVFMHRGMVRRSLNYLMLRYGHAYPLFYETLFPDLRGELSRAVGRARGTRRGLWRHDRSQTWFEARDLDGLQNDIPIFPKLFRRIVAHRRAGRPLSTLESRLGERITIIPRVHHTDFDYAVEVAGTRVRMTERPEDLVFGTVLR